MGGFCVRSAHRYCQENFCPVSGFIVCLQVHQRSDRIWDETAEVARMVIATSSAALSSKRTRRRILCAISGRPTRAAGHRLLWLGL